MGGGDDELDEQMMGKRAAKTISGVRSVKRLEREARLTGGIATKILRTFRKEAGKGRKKNKAPTSGGIRTTKGWCSATVGAPTTRGSNAGTSPTEGDSRRR